MTTYSLSAAHQIVQSALGHEITPEQAATVARNFGIEVEDPQPEPGVYLHENGQLVILIGDGFKEYSQYTTTVHNSHWVDQNRDKLTPARVVPAEPVEIADEEVEGLWDYHADKSVSLWLECPMEFRKSVLAVVRGALAKYGHGAA